MTESLPTVRLDYNMAEDLYYVEGIKGRTATITIEKVTNRATFVESGHSQVIRVGHQLSEKQVDLLGKVAHLNMQGA